jgi:predicted ATP-grasp superfamily ATP-dependent carboligase
VITQQANGNNSDSGRKEEFRNYLQRTNVIDVLTKVLVGLYEEPERPSNAIEYIRKYMGAPANVDVDSIKKENEDLKAQIEKLTTELEESKAKQHLVLKS